ncbi:Kelch repeat-containing protein [Carboxylicivirga marina]|uniref:Kelch repeat-containing protein n=1 Tax=Carboxylicivirga marina TaxID=2800988 RepID=UPI00190977BF|nr:kelch repeat-containing protein [Carboxylicivirga marina]
MHDFYKRLLLFVCVSLMSAVVNAQGLQFNSNNELIINRTSYDVFASHSPVFKDEFEIKFDISIINPFDFGYICQIHIDGTIFSLTFANKNSLASSLKLNVDGVKNLTSIELDNSTLGRRKWLPISIRFSHKDDQLVFIVEDTETYIDDVKFKHKMKPRVFFGKKGSVIDVPEFALRKLHLIGADKSFLFEFNEKSGNEVHESNGRKMGHVDNPHWLISESFHWKLRHDMSLPGMAVVNYDANHERMVIASKDSVLFYDYNLSTLTGRKSKNKLSVPLRLGMSFWDMENRLFYVYELNDVANGAPTIMALDINNLRWSKISDKQLAQQKHHHNGFFNSKNQSYLVFGGFGNQRFSNDFLKYNIASNEWGKVEMKGDIISPRYFSGATSVSDDELIIYGGIGNRSGDQTLGKTYFYDCYSVNTSTNTVKKMWEIPKLKDNLVSSRSMVLTKDSSSFFTLCYPEYISNSLLQLYQFSIEDGTHELLGDSIPIFSERIETNANLYYNSNTNELYCSVQEILPDSTSNIKLYSISAPPLSKSELYHETHWRFRSFFPYLVSILISFLCASLIFFVRKQRNEVRKNLNEQRERVQFSSDRKKHNLNLKNAICLFGGFKIIDRKGVDISYMFSPKIKQLFMLILWNSIRGDGGVSSEVIYASVWPDRPEQKAKNSKGVTINQIRKILVDIDGIELSFHKNRFHLDINENLYCDLLAFDKELEEFRLNEGDRNEYIIRILDIISNGPFLESFEFDFLDKFKEEVENVILDIFLQQIDEVYASKNYALVIKIAKVIFYVDSLNEKAFKYELVSLLKLDMVEVAKKSYNKFLLKYNHDYNEDYPHTFNDMSKM